jgi:hypothetical protein
MVGHQDLTPLSTSRATDLRRAGTTGARKAQNPGDTARDASDPGLAVSAAPPVDRRPHLERGAKGGTIDVGAAVPLVIIGWIVGMDRGGSSPRCRSSAA